MSDNLTRAEARDRAGLVGDVRYEVELDLTGDDRTFASTTTVHFTSARIGASTFLDLDAAEVETVECNGRVADAADVDGCRIRLHDLTAANTVVVRARCRYQTTGVGLHRFVDPVDGRPYLHTQFEPFDAHRVFACFDQPDLKAPLTLSVVAPADWHVVSNGEVVQRRDDGPVAVTRFATTEQLSTYITALVAGPFHVLRDTHETAGTTLDLGLYCRQSLAKFLDADEVFTVTKQGFDFFTRVFDQPYPFGSKYDQLFVPEFNAGAMENVGCVTFTESYIFRSKVTDAAREARASTITHEMAHMWFGDLVTMRWWDDLWLNESFATYVGTLAVAEATRFTDAWADFASSMKAWALAQDQLPSTHPIKADIVDTDAVRTNFDGITYAKGAAVLKQLVAWVGKDAFLAGCRDYFARHAYGNAELADFLAALEKASGRDLEAWSQQWLETAGPNTLRPRTQMAADGTYEAFAVEQVATPEHRTLRDHRLAIGLYDLDGGRLSRRTRIELDVTGASTAVPTLVGEHQPDLLLLNDDDLTFAKIRLDERSVDTMVASLSALDEPVARAMCWSAAWDMTRDAELPARRFVALIARHAEGETAIGNLQTLLRQAQAAVERYGDPANRAAARAQLAAAARVGMEASEPGSDRQLAWARCLISNAVAPEDLTWARGLLDGSTAVEGLEVDTELRWLIVTALAAAGAIDDDGIAAEHDRDATDIGARRAAEARAARPTPEAKAEAWALLTRDREPSLAMRRAVAAGFHQSDQEPLLEPYVERYAADLGSLWQGRGIEESLLLTGRLFPQAVVTPAVLSMADELLAGDLPAPARRLVLEARDQTARALRARAADRG